MFGQRSARLIAARWIVILSLLFAALPAFAQSDEEEQEPVAVIEIGSAPSRSLTEHQSSFGPTIAGEMTPVPNWLEFEMGVTSLFGPHSREWDTDFIFKKPWDLTKTIEFMAGIGPEWVNTRANGVSTNSFAGEAVLDFMFWPNGKHKIGWYFEPAYDYSFRAGHEHSIGASIGILIGIPRRAHSN